MKKNIELTEEQYQELIELIFLGDHLKTKDIIPTSYEQMINLPSTKLRNYILSQSNKFNSDHLIETHVDLKGQFFLNSSDDLIEEYFDY